MAWMLLQSIQTHSTALRDFLPSPARRRPYPPQRPGGLWLLPETNGSRWLWGAVWRPGCEASMALGPYSSLGQPVHKERRGNLIDSLKIRTISSSSPLPLFRSRDWRRHWSKPKPQVQKLDSCLPDKGPFTSLGGLIFLFPAGRI